MRAHSAIAGMVGAHHHLYSALDLEEIRAKAAEQAVRLHRAHEA